MISVFGAMSCLGKLFLGDTNEHRFLAICCFWGGYFFFGEGGVFTI